MADARHLVIMLLVVGKDAKDDIGVSILKNDKNSTSIREIYTNELGRETTVK